MIILGDENETSIYPAVNIGLIAITCCAFVYQFFFAGGAENIAASLGFVPSRFLADPNFKEIATLFTSMFLHAGLLHLIGNLWFLYIFGDNVEEFFGHVNYLFFYLICGVAGALLTIAYEPTSSIPSIGASGAIAGVLGAYLVLHPRAGVKTWWGDDSFLFAFRTCTIPAWVIIGFWFIMQYVCLFLKVPGIGWIDHIGGFTTGLVLALVYKTVHGAVEETKAATYQPYVAGSSYLPQNKKSSAALYETDSHYLTKQPLPANMLRGGIVFALILATAGSAAWLAKDYLNNRGATAHATDSASQKVSGTTDSTSGNIATHSAKNTVANVAKPTAKVSPSKRQKTHSPRNNNHAPRHNARPHTVMKNSVS
jgi:membrane associated rhomboid family serine protease